MISTTPLFASNLGGSEFHMAKPTLSKRPRKQKHKMNIRKLIKLGPYFIPFGSEAILQMPLQHPEREDIPIWSYSPKGVFSVKGAYQFKDSWNLKKIVHHQVAIQIQQHSRSSGPLSHWKVS
ncbi:hypothetical protein LIER_37699 [Lithospermum erythrorhizon]|uniref:Uncharacterized protein n=1 Tax=Lithospermum erythrorhizon TaxID=34254 RepID=A0AAV3PUE8_LITER